MLLFKAVRLERTMGVKVINRSGSRSLSLSLADFRLANFCTGLRVKFFFFVKAARRRS